MNTEEILSRILDYKSFMTVEELDESTLRLAEKYPETVKVSEIGKSREGRPIYCLRIGEGSENALLMGCPHPNEPIGAMMLEAFSEILAEDEDLRRELDFTFYIVKAVDPDGLKRNEGWLKGPYTYYQYARHFFRPAPQEQVEWTFPIDYKELHFDRPIPETRALMKLIDETCPRFLYSLHNSGFSGAYWYAFSENGSGYLAKELPKIPDKYNLVLKKGEPEAPFCIEFGDAVYQFMNTEDMYDYYEKSMPTEVILQMINFGATSLSYANRKGKACDGLIAEVGYFKSDCLQDLTESGYSRRETVAIKGKSIKKVVESLAPYKKKLEKYLPADNQYLLALAGIGDNLIFDVVAEEKLMAESPEEYERPATKAQWFDNCIAMPYMMSLWYGMTASAAEQAANMAEEAEREELEKIKEATETDLREVTEVLESQFPCEPFSIRDMVAYQLESGLVGMYAAKMKNKPKK